MCSNSIERILSTVFATYVAAPTCAPLTPTLGRYRAACHLVPRVAARSASRFSYAQSERMNMGCAPYPAWQAAEESASMQSLLIHELVRAGGTPTRAQLEDLARVRARAHALYLELMRCYHERQSISQILARKAALAALANISADTHSASRHSLGATRHPLPTGDAQHED